MVRLTYAEIQILIESLCFKIEHLEESLDESNTKIMVLEDKTVVLLKKIDILSKKQEGESRI